MKIGETIKSVLQVAFVCGCIYAVVKWDDIKPQGNESSDFAEHACVGEIRDRFAASSVSVYAVDKTNNGYVVRASITLPRGAPAKVYCLTNDYGGVEEFRVEEQ
jgi:hypothetical protein